MMADIEMENWSPLLIFIYDYNLIKIKTPEFSGNLVNNNSVESLCLQVWMLHVEEETAWHEFYSHAERITSAALWRRRAAWRRQRCPLWTPSLPHSLHALQPCSIGTVTPWMKDPPKWGAAGPQELIPGWGSSRQLCRWGAPIVTVMEQGDMVLMGDGHG